MKKNAKWIVAAALAVLALAAVVSALSVDGVKVGKQGTVMVFAEESFAHLGSSQYITKQSSGFAVGKGGPVSTFVTNRHGVEPDAVEIDGKTGVGTMRYFIVFEDETTWVPAVLEAVSDRTDLAVLSIADPTAKRSPLRLKPFGELRTGEAVSAIGFPGIADNIRTSGSLAARTRDMSGTSGTVSRVLRSAENTFNAEVIQIDADITHGNSGGPLIDGRGNVLGVTSAGFSSDGSAPVSGINFAISSNEVMRFLDDEHIAYQTAGALSPVTIGIIVIAAAILIVGAMVLSEGRKRSGGRPAPASGTRALVDAGGKRYKLGGKTVIGRDPARCGIVLAGDAPGVSRVHCTVRFENGVVTVTDENSSYGTYIDGQKLEPGKSAVMHRGQTLCLGGAGRNGLSLHS